MSAPHEPLTVETALLTVHLDLVTDVVGVIVLAGYWWARRRSRVSVGRALVFTVGVAIWLASASSFVGAYADTLFWVRALGVVLLVLVVPFGLASGMPLTVARDALGAGGRARFDAAMRSRFARVLTYPAVTSALILVTPWLFYLTGWYEAVLRGTALDVATRLLFVAIGFLYFYSRLQLDPVPRRYPQLVSLLITVVETIGDGALGVVIWQGHDIAGTYYAAIDRTWGPAPRTDQIIGAGILWVLGDVVGLPFLLTLMSRFTSDEKARAVEVDAELDATPALWWQSDPGLRDRFTR